MNLQKEVINIISKEIEIGLPTHLIVFNILPYLESHKEYYKDSKQIKKEWYTDSFGRYHGEYKAWNEDGSKILIMNFKNGKRHGDYESFYSQTIKDITFIKASYDNGKLHGEYKEYYISGTLRIKTNYKYNKVII